MSQVLFYCPECAYSRKISKSDIPPTAKQCKCPSCRKLLPVSAAIKPLETDETEALIPTKLQDSTTEEKTAPKQATSELPTKAPDNTLELLEEALTKLKHDHDLEAMMLLEQLEKQLSTPRVRSYLAYCRARIRYEFADAIRTCAKALKDEPNNYEHYLNLGRIYLLANKRGPALQTFRKGIKLAPHPLLSEEYRKFEMRKPAVISSLPRDHFLNRKLGIFLSRLKLR